MNGGQGFDGRNGSKAIGQDRSRLFIIHLVIVPQDRGQHRIKGMPHKTGLAAATDTAHHIEAAQKKASVHTLKVMCACIREFDVLILRLDNATLGPADWFFMIGLGLPVKDQLPTLMPGAGTDFHKVFCALNEIPW